MSMWIAGAISLGSGIISGISGKAAGKKQADAAIGQANRNAELSWMTTREELRRVDVDNAKILSSAKALSSASGFSAGGSHDTYIENLDQELTAERDWMEMSGRVTADNIRQGGQYTADTIDSRANSAALSSVMGGVNQFGASQNWWMS